MELERITVAQGRQDVQASRIEGFPYLRINRFWASFKGELAERPAMRFWLHQLAELDDESRLVEINNLSFSNKQLDRLASSGKIELISRLRNCRDLFIESDLRQQPQLERILKNASVADNYNTAARILGLYPVSKLFVMAGVKKLHADMINAFQQMGSADEETPPLNYYAPRKLAEQFTQPEIAALLQRNANNLLAIPILTERQKAILFSQFAPVWAIEVAGDDDKPGAPYWTLDKQLAIDTNDATVYRYVSYARMADKTLLQLNYVIWFPSRPLTGLLDILGGHLDGITWRVTLGEHGRPVMFDAMHNCGCYHMIFPGNGVKQRVASFSGEEPILVPTIAPEVSTAERIAVHIGHGTHYIKGLRAVADVDENPDGEYKLANYNTLRSLPLVSGDRKSMFGANGIVAGTSRKERWLLWPMGILDPGAMRQRGHHAIAFVGRRHFDAPRLFEKYFSYDPI